MTYGYHARKAIDKVEKRAKSKELWRLEARRAAVAREVRILRRKRPKKLIVIIPVKKPD